LQEDFYCTPLYFSRPNKSPRKLEIPNPIPYIILAKHINDMWSKIEEGITIKKHERRISQITIKDKPDGSKRLVSKAGNYRDGSINDKVYAIKSERRYQVKVDIVNFYKSIYTHSISWAAYGRQDAFKKRNNPNDDFDKWDKYTRQLQMKESIGLPIGPDTSSIFSEYILSSIDKELKSDFDYERYIDDYRVYCKSQEEAEKFVLLIDKKLQDFRLSINNSKTIIEKINFFEQEKDYYDIKRCFRSLDIKSKFIDQKSQAKWIEFIEYIFNEKGLDYLPYGLGYLRRKLLNASESEKLVGILLNIAYEYPDFVGIIFKLMFNKVFNKNDEKFQNLIKSYASDIISKNKSGSRTDTLLYPILSSIYLDFDLPCSTFENIIGSNDPIAIVAINNLLNRRCLGFTDVIRDKMDRYVNSLIGSEREAENWILIYEYFYHKDNCFFPEKVKYKKCFDFFKERNVYFFAP